MKLLYSLALIKSQYDKTQNDYIENFVPLLGNLIIDTKYDKYDFNNESCIHDLIQDFYSIYGMKVPYHPMISIITRATKRGVFRKSGRSLIKCSDCQKFNLESEVEGYTLKFERLYESIQVYASKQYNINLDMTQIDDIIINFLKSDEFDIYYDSKSSSVLLNNKDNYKESENLVLLSSYIKHIYENGSIEYSLFMQFIFGFFLANAITYSRNTLYDGNFKNLAVYLDTPIIFKVLGLEGELSEEAFIEIIKILIENGASLFLFKHDYDEILQILEACKHFLTPDRYDPSKSNRVLDYFYENEFTASDVELFINTLQNKLMNFEITIIDKPSYSDESKHKFQIDEVEAMNRIKEHYQNNNHKDIDTLSDTIRIDVQSMVSIQKLREGSHPRNLKEARYIFVTNNFTLAKISNDLENKDDEIKYKTLPAIVTDTFIGTLLWLHNPLKYESIINRKLIEHCCSVLKPDNRFMERVLKQASILRERDQISDEEFIVIKSVKFRQDALLEIALNDQSIVDPNTTMEMLREMQHKFANPIKEELNRERLKNQQLEEKNHIYEIEKAKIRNKILEASKVISCIIIMPVIIMLCCIAFIDNNLSRIILSLLTVVAVIVEMNFLKFRVKIAKYIFDLLCHLFGADEV